jgi:serine/threonine protein kinase
MRLRVAIEVAGALSYLHSSASSPIYHQDIKSSNILLDDKYRVKVADFGTSRSVSIDKTHLTMSQVQGTFGYLDPEYFQTSQFTDKSDVYSFGVVLAELLTGKKPIFQTKSEEAISLSNYFLVSLEENRLFDILDARVMNGGKQEIMAVADLAKRCLNLKGRKRPTMRDAAVELERIFQLQGKDYHVERTTSEIGYVRNRKTEVWDGRSTSVPSSIFSEYSGTTGSSFDMQPLVSIKTE